MTCRHTESDPETTTSIMAGTDTEITRETAIDVQRALHGEERQLRAELDTTTDPAQRAGLYRRATTNQRSQALAWDRRPGRARDKRPRAALYRWEARRCAAAAQIEQSRAHAADQGRALPDPAVLLDAVHTDDSATQALIALYTAAAAGPVERTP
jgi:hypothetical protein